MSGGEVLQKLEALGYEVKRLQGGNISLRLPGGLPDPADSGTLLAMCRILKDDVLFCLEARENGFRIVDDAALPWELRETEE